MKHDRFLKAERLLCMALVILCGFAFSSCSAPAAVPAQRETAQSSRFPLSCLIEQFTSEQPEADSDWFQAFSERYQVDISLTSIPTLDFIDRLSYLLTTDELPALIMTNNKLTQTGVLNRAVDSGAFWNLDNYIQDYPDLMAYFGTDALNNARINGKLYGLPRLRPLGRNGILYRKDWADNLGLAEPKTIEDLFEMIRAFQQGDPDGNGIQDTRGLVNCWKSWANIGWNGIQMLTVINGGPNGWAYENGTMQPDFLSDAWVSALSFFRRLREDGLLNEDFSILNAEQRRLAITTGNVGVEFCVIDDIISLSEQLAKTDPHAELGILPLLSLDENSSPRLNSTTGNNGLLLFTKAGKNAIKTDEELRFILSMYNDFCTPAGQDFLLNGLKDIHYTEDEEGKHAVASDAGGSLLAEQQGDFSMLLPIQSYERIGNQQELVRQVNDELESRKPYLKQDDSIGLFSSTYAAKGNRLNQMIYEASMRFILGEIDETVYRDACVQWCAAGGSQVIEEYTQQFRALHPERAGE